MLADMKLKILAFAHVVLRVVTCLLVQVDLSP